MMNASNINSSTATTKPTQKNNSSSARDCSEAVLINQRLKSSTDQRPDSSSSMKICSPPLQSTGSTVLGKPSTSPTGRVPTSVSQATSSQSETSSPKNNGTNSYNCPTSPHRNYTPSNSTSICNSLLSVPPPNSMSAYASLTVPPANINSIAELVAHNPCTDPLCRDLNCPATMLRSSHHYASLMAAASASSRHPGYMYASGGIPALPVTGIPSLIPPTNHESQPPFICNWMIGGDFCGKRFPSGEELMTHLRLHTSASTTSPISPTSSRDKHNAHISPTNSGGDPALAALQAAQVHALYPHLTPPLSSASSTSALAALQAQAARATSCSKSSTSPSSAATSSSVLTSSRKSPLDPSMVSAMAMASAVQAAQATAAAQVAASARYHPYARAATSILHSPSLMNSIAANHPHLPSAMHLTSSPLPAAYPPFLQPPFGLPLL